MAEIAIAAAVAAAVSAAAYTVQYALTPKAKPIEQGRLRGDVLIQDSRYGHMIPILLGGQPYSASGGCSPGPQRDARWTDLDNLELHVNGELNKNGGVPATYDAEAFSTPLFPGDRCFDIQWEATELKHTQRVTIVIENEDGDSSSRQGWGMRLFVGSVPVMQAIKDGADHLSFVGYDFPTGFRIRSRGDGTGRIEYITDGLSEDAGFGSNPGHEIDIDVTKNYRVHVLIAGYDGNTDLLLDAEATAPAVTIGDGRSQLDGEGGGCRVAGNVVFMSDVRKVETITPAEGGKGFGNKNPDTKTIRYFCDLAIMFGEGELELAELYAGTDLLIALNSSAPGTGVRYAALGADPDADNLELLSPSDSDTTDRQALRYGSQPTADDNGTVTGSMAGGGGADFRFYAGSETQLPDPLLEAHFGVGDTPAYLGRSYIVLENFEVGLYGAIPNFTAILNNKNLRTAADCLDHLCQRVGLEPTDFDFDNVADFDVRGIPIVNREAPVSTVNLIGKLFGFDVVETNGEIIAVERGGASSFAITEDDLGTIEVDETEDPQDADNPELIQHERQLDQTTLPRRLDLTFFDTARKGETNTAGASRLEALALGFHTDEVNAVLTFTEGRQLAQRLLDTAWIESGGAIRFTVPHTFAADITAAAVGTVTRNGITHKLRVKEVNGFVPGPLEVVGVLTRAASYVQTQVTPGESAGAPVTTPAPPSIPATTVATFIDRLLRDRELQDGRPGFYVAACSFGNGSWGGCSVAVDRGNGFVHVINVPEQATMGVVNATDATLTGSSEVDVELYADQTLPTGEPVPVIQGNLVYTFETAEQLSTTPNLWRVSDITNIGARCTTGENGSLAAGARFVVLNEALRFVSVESAEIDVARDYKVRTAGQDINDAGAISFTVTSPNTAVTTPGDWTMTDGDGQITHNWTPFADECVLSDSLIYEIYDDAAGSPGALIYSGNSQPFVETGLTTATYTRHFRARTKFSEGSYLMDSIAVTATGGGSGITELTGDVTAGPGSGSQAATIANDAVSYAKMQNVSAASRVLGRGSSAGSGDVQELQFGSGFVVSGTTINVTGGGGTGNTIVGAALGLVEMIRGTNYTM